MTKAIVGCKRLLAVSLKPAPLLAYLFDNSTAKTKIIQTYWPENLALFQKTPPNQFVRAQRNTPRNPKPLECVNFELPPEINAEHSPMAKF